MQYAHFLRNTLQPSGLESESESVPESNVIKPLIKWKFEPPYD